MIESEAEQSTMLFGKVKHGDTIGRYVGMVPAFALLGWSAMQTTTAMLSANASVAEAQQEEKNQKEPAWMSDARRAYGLKDGELVKHMTAPFPGCRQFLQGASFPNREVVMNYRWDGKKLWVAALTLKPELPIGWSLIDILGQLGISPQDIQVEAGLGNTYVEGEFVVRHGVSVDKLVPPLERILREDLKHSLRLKFADTERDIVVVGGKYAPKPGTQRRPNHIDLFAVAIELHGPDASGGGGGGSFDEFLQHAGTFIGRKLVNELAGTPKARISWSYHNSQRVLRGPDPNVEPEGVLRNISAQTGLTFKAERRKVRMLFVEKD